MRGIFLHVRFTRYIESKYEFNLYTSTMKIKPHYVDVCGDILVTNLEK